MYIGDSVADFPCIDIDGIGRTKERIMRVKGIRRTIGVTLAAVVIMTGTAGSAVLGTALGAAGEVAVAEKPAAESALSASIDASFAALQPQALADMAQHALDAGVAGAAGGLASRAIARKGTTSRGAFDVPQGTQDIQFDAPTG